MANNLTRGNARLIKPLLFRNLEEFVNILLEYRNRGESVYAYYDGHIFYSCDVQMDEAYKEVFGYTKEESRNKAKRAAERHLKQKQQEKEKIPEWIKEGFKYIYPQRKKEWEDLAKGSVDLDLELEIMKALNTNAPESLQKAIEIWLKKGDNIIELDNILRFSKRGPEFFEAVSSEEGKEVYKDIIAKIRKENQQFAKEIETTQKQAEK